MQIKLTSEVQELLAQYIVACKDIFKGYKVKPTQIANGMLEFQLKQELRRYEKKKPWPLKI